MVESLKTIGDEFTSHRRKVLLKRQEGLTATYNRFHDPACQDADIIELRRLHVVMDNEVLAAYGWQDLALDHAFRHPDYPTLADMPAKERGAVRYTLSDGVKEELLRRLLQLNFAIAGNQKDEGTKGTKKKKETAVVETAVADKPGQAWQPGLFGDVAHQPGLLDETA